MKKNYMARITAVGALFACLSPIAMGQPQHPTTLVIQRSNIQAVREAPQPVKQLGGDLQWKLHKIELTDTQGREIELQLSATAAGMIPSDGGFRGILHVLVEDAGNPSNQVNFQPPLQISVTAPVQVNPGVVELSRTGQVAQIELKASSPKNPVPVTVGLGAGVTPVKIDVPVIRHDLTLDASPKSIQGLGLEKTTITVTAGATAGPQQELSLTLTTDRGSLTAHELKLGSAGRAETTLRSISIGTATLTAKGGGLNPATTSVRFEWPWAFAIAALVGGIVGSLIRRWRRLRSSVPTRSVWLEVVLGILTGVLAAAAYAIGVNLLVFVGFQPDATAGEALVFVLSALAALFGIQGPSSSRPSDEQSPA